ncbi:virion structural protein [Vibrio phage K299]
MRECFKDWTEIELQRLVKKSASEEVSAEDLDEAAKEIAQRQMEIALMANAVRRNTRAMKGVSDGGRALAGLVTRDPHEEVKRLPMEQRINAIRNGMMSKVSDFMTAMSPSFRQTMAGVATGERALSKDQIKLTNDFVHETFGRQTGNADAQKAAKGWKEMTNELNERFKRAGGNMNELDDWRLPQRHDAMKMRDVDVDEWTTFITPLLDLDKMKKKSKKYASDGAVNAQIERSYYNIVTDGASSSQMKNTKLKDMMKNGRFLVFKDPEGWLKYQAKFGEPNTYASMIQHMDFMSKTVGAMETFGPDPDEGFNILARSISAAEGGDEKMFRGAKASYDLLMGYSTIEGTPSLAAQGMTGMRNLWTASKLGASTLAATTDSVYGAMAAKYSGLSSGRLLKNMFSELPKKHSDPESLKKWAMDFQFGAEFAIDRMMMSNDSARNLGGHRTQNLAEAVMIANGSNRWTQSARASFQYEFMTALSRASDLGWDELPSKMRMSMERYGIPERGWKRMQKSQRTMYKGTKMLDPNNMSDELATRLTGMIQGETILAVPTPDARTRSFMMGGTKAGSAGGEFIRTLMMFHSFPITMLMNNTRRVYKGKSYNSQGDRAMDWAMMLGATTVLGTGIIQVKEMLAGKEPMSFDDPDLWVKGMAQGGGFSYLGDVIAKSSSGYDNSMTSYAGGPIVGYGDWLLATSKDVAEGEFARARGRAASFGIKQLPFNNLWYTKLATDRLVMDRINSLADPNYNKKQIQKMRKMRKDNDQEYWWSPTGGR